MEVKCFNERVGVDSEWERLRGTAKVAPPKSAEWTGTWSDVLPLRIRPLAGAAAVTSLGSNGGRHDRQGKSCGIDSSRSESVRSSSCTTSLSDSDSDTETTVRAAIQHNETVQ